MRVTGEENLPSSSEGKFHVFLAWLSLWLMGGGGGAIALFLISFAIFFAIGGVELVNDVWVEQENRGNDYSSVIYASIFIGIPIGALSGVWLWSKLMRKTGFLNVERIKRMSGF